MNRMTIGAALGGAAMYFFDPQQGEDRRRRIQSLWRENRDTALEVGGGVSQAAESMRPLVRRMKRGLERRDWAEDDGPNWVPVVTGIVVSTAFGGALMYFLDPENGLVRRQRVVHWSGLGALWLLGGYSTSPQPIAPKRERLSAADGAVTAPTGSLPATL
jgi:hypothetical protein